DINGDGFSDISQVGPNNISIYESNGYSFKLSIHNTANDIYYLRLSPYRHKGLGTLGLLAQKNKYVALYNSSTNSVQDFLPFFIYDIFDNPKPQMLKIKEGLARSFEFDYETLSENKPFLSTGEFLYTRGSQSSYPLIDLQKPISVVKRFYKTGSLFLDEQTFFQYESAIFSLNGRGFLGFGKIKATNVEKSFKTETIQEIDPTHYIPYIKETKTYNTATNQQITHKVNNINFTQGSISGTFYRQLASQ